MREVKIRIIYSKKVILINSIMSHVIRLINIKKRESFTFDMYVTVLSNLVMSGTLRSNWAVNFGLCD